MDASKGPTPRPAQSPSANGCDKHCRCKASRQICPGIALIASEGRVLALPMQCRERCIFIDCDTALKKWGWLAPRPQQCDVTRPRLIISNQCEKPKKISPGVYPDPAGGAGGYLSLPKGRNIDFGFVCVPSVVLRTCFAREIFLSFTCARVGRGSQGVEGQIKRGSRGTPPFLVIPKIVSAN